MTSPNVGSKYNKGDVLELADIHAKQYIKTGQAIPVNVVTVEMKSSDVGIIEKIEPKEEIKEVIVIPKKIGRKPIK